MPKKTFKPELYGETESSLMQWLSIIKKERIPLYNAITSYIKQHTTAIEIGAGSAWLSALLSQNSHITHISAIDNDARRLQLAQDYFAPALHANQNKIDFYKSDFHKIAHIEDHSIDIVFIDAALHHTDHLSILLQELSRVLKNDGYILALREPVLPSFYPLKIIRKFTFGRKQKMIGDIENTYSQKEWHAHFAQNQFTLRMIPLFDGSAKDHFLSLFPFRHLNGVLYGRYFFVATRSLPDKMEM